MSRTLQAVLDESNPNRSDEAQHQVLLGSALGLVTRFAKGAVVANVLVLPDDAKAGRVLRAFATAGGATGMLTPVNPEGAVAAGQVGTTPGGDVLFAVADAITAAEVEYAVLEGAGIFEEDIDVAASVGALSQGRGAVVLISAEVTVGIILGAKPTSARGAAPAAGFAAIDALGTSIAFNAADVVAGKAHVKYSATPGVGPGTTASLAGRLATVVGY